MKILSKVIVGCAALVLFGCFSGSAYADGLVLVSADIQKLVPPISALNFEHHGSRKVESGGVLWNGTSDVSFGDISAGPHQQTVSLTDLGIGRASDLRVLLNINEANGGGKKLSEDTPFYRVMHRWIEQGAPYGRKEDPTLTRIEVFPEDLPRVIDADARARIVAGFRGLGFREITVDLGGLRDALRV